MTDALREAGPLDLIEDGDADILIKALKAYRPETLEEENAVLYYIGQLQKVAADAEESVSINRDPLPYWKNK